MGKHLPIEELVLYKAIDQLLWEEWDPIGVNAMGEPARDEYHSYLPEVFKLAQSNRSKADLSNYLLDIEVNYMGLKGNKTRCDQVASLILEVKDKPSK